MKKLLTFAFAIAIAVSAFGQCYTDRHNTNWNDAWISCDMSQSPNPERGISHWIQYNLGAKYGLGQCHIWNYNEPDSTDRGIQDVVIDYSLDDGLNWYEWGTYTFAQASGSSIYEGDLGPDFKGLGATSILITAINNYGGDCYALGELKIDIAEFSSDEDLLAEDFAVTVSPNPANEAFAFTLVSESSGSLVYTLYNSEGKIIIQGNADFLAGTYRKEINAANLPTDTYFLEIAQGKLRTTKKISVSH